MRLLCRLRPGWRADACLTAQGEYRADHPVIRWLWELMHEATPTQRLAFLRFVSGADAMPVGGFANLGNPPCTVRDGDALRSMSMLDGAACAQIRPVMVGPNPTARLPSSHTCFRLLVRTAMARVTHCGALTAAPLLMAQDLPVYGSKAVLREKLITAIACESFGMA
jgi:hypothetical protein